MKQSMNLRIPGLVTQLIAVLWVVWSCGATGAPEVLDHEPSRVPIGPLTLGVWLPAGLDEFRFGADDQARLEALGVNYIEWLQPAVVDEWTAEQWAMDFCDRTGHRMPVYYPPAGFTAYDKLHNWATTTTVEPDFALQVRERVVGLRHQWDGAPGFHGYLVGHEDYSSDFYEALRRTVRVLSEEDAARPALTVGRLDAYASPTAFMDAFFDESGEPNIFQHEHYIFTGDLPTHGKRFQRRVDDLVRGYQQVTNGLQGRLGRWHAIVQVHSEKREGPGFSQHKYRKPTPAEIRLQAGLALTRGAAGIIYFVYSSGLEELRDGDGVVRELRTYGGLVDSQGMPTERYGGVRALNQELRALGSRLEKLHFHGSFSSRRLRLNPLVLSTAPALEFGLFGDGLNADTALILNRRTTESRVVEIGVGGREVVDLLTDQRLKVIDGKISLELAAAGWRLLQLRQLPEVE